MTSFEQARAICRRNANGKTGARDPNTPLEWDRETATTMVTNCGRYRISRMEDPHNPGIFGYGLSLAATPTSPPKHLSGPFFTPKDARDAAQAHLRGEPLQADLA